jgi:hypothetical protein
MKPNTASASIRILKIATCPSLSGKSTLTYHIACTTEDGIMFRVFENSAAGLFSREWVLLKAIGDEFSKIKAGDTITSFQLFPLFKGRSQNTPAFLFAALKHEGLVESAGEDQRRYVCAGSAMFMQEIGELMVSNIDLDDSAPTSGDGTKSSVPKASRGKSASGKDSVKAKPAKSEQVENT